MLRKTKKEDIFFDKFYGVAELIAEASVKLLSITKDYSQIDVIVKEIDELESRCDSRVHEIYNLVHKSFITPIDREDIHSIAKYMDDIMDAIEDAAMRLVIFDVKELNEEAKFMIQKIEVASQQLLELMKGMHQIKKVDALKKNIIAINNLENECDAYFMSGLRKVFSGKLDTLEVMKWKYIFDYLEKTMDKFEDVANLVEGVAIKHG